MEKLLSPVIAHRVPQTAEHKSSRERQRTIGSAESRHLTSVGLGLFYAWAWMLCQNTFFYHGGDPTSMARVFWIVTLVVGQIIWIPVLLTKKSGFSLANRRFFPAAMASLMALGTILIATAHGETVAGSAQLYLGSALAGLGEGAMPVMWGERYGLLSCKQASIAVGLSTILGAAVYFTIPHLPGLPMQVAATAMLPVLSTLLLRDGRHADTVVTHLRSAAGLRSPLRLAVIPASYGLVYGVVLGLTNFMSGVGLSNSGPTTVIGSTIGALLLMVSALVFSKNLNVVGFTYRMIVPILGVGLALLPLSNQPLLASGLVLSGFLLFDLILYVILSDVSHRLGYPAAKGFALGRSMSHGGILVGVVVGRAILGQTSLDQRALVTVSLTLLFVLIFTLAIALNDRSVVSGWGLAPGAPTAAPKTSADEMTRGAAPPGLHEFAAAHELSKREGEVFELLAQGRTLKYIGKMLFISEGTTKYHVRNIYHKVGVHSRQELLDRVEGRPTG